MPHYQAQKSIKSNNYIHDLNYKFSYDTQDPKDSQDTCSNSVSYMGDLDNHETRYGKKRYLKANRTIRFIADDVVFQDAKRVLGLYPQVIYKMIQAAGATETREKTAFIISLFQTHYFNLDQQGRLDTSIPVNQQRARNTLMGLVYGRQAMYLDYAGPYYFTHYPEPIDP